MTLGILKFSLFLIFLFYPFPSYAEPVETNIAEIQILDKITAKVKTYNIKKNNSLKIDSLNVEIYACFKSPPEEIPEDYVLLKIYDSIDNSKNNLIYQGWMISSSPSATPLEHPIYDLWLKDCKLDKDS